MANGLHERLTIDLELDVPTCALTRQLHATLHVLTKIGYARHKGGANDRAYTTELRSGHRQGIIPVQTPGRRPAAPPTTMRPPRNRERSQP